MLISRINQFLSLQKQFFIPVFSVVFVKCYFYTIAFVIYNKFHIACNKQEIKIIGIANMYYFPIFLFFFIFFSAPITNVKEF